MLAVTNDRIVLQVFFSDSQHHFLHNFIRHRIETVRSVIADFIFLALLSNWNSICQLPDNWELA